MSNAEPAAEPLPAEPLSGVPTGELDGDRTAAAGPTQSPSPLIRELREQVLQLTRQLDGPVRRVSLTAGACTVEVEWAAPNTSPNIAPAAAAAPIVAAPAPVPAPFAGPAAASAAPAATPAAADGSVAAPAHRVTAPLVGTFYRAPEPGADPFVEVGDLVEPGRPLAIVEAMKLMNEITADVRGRIAAVHPTDGEIVEYDQPLFDITPVEVED
jgi:acetyl-CoA carboxylase biotin carboxyl carrier protein